jgi:TonB-dependent Receptor Plug Domain
MMRIMSLAGVVAVFFLACAPPSTARSGREANVITKEEILDTHASNVYDAITRLRPNFLHYRGQTTIRGADTGYPRVYLDRTLIGDISSLKTMNTNGIREIRYYNGPEASGRFGLDNVSGAIEVISDTGQ